MTKQLSTICTISLYTQTEQDEADTWSECEVIQPTICGGVGAQPDLCSLLDLPILQDEVECAFSRVKKEAAPGKDGISFRMMNTTACLELVGGLV